MLQCDTKRSKPFQDDRNGNCVHTEQKRNLSLNVEPTESKFAGFQKCQTALAVQTFTNFPHLCLPGNSTAIDIDF